MKIDPDPHIVTTVKSMLTRHVGGSNRADYDELTRLIFGSITENNRRKLRAVISAINAESDNRLVVCSDRDEGGLFINGATDEDIEAHLKFIGQEEAQAMSTLQKIHAMKTKLRVLYGDRVYQDQAQGRLF